MGKKPSEAWREKSLEDNEQRARELQDSAKRPNMGVIGAPEQQGGVGRKIHYWKI